MPVGSIKALAWLLAWLQLGLKSGPDGNDRLSLTTVFESYAVTYAKPPKIAISLGVFIGRWGLLVRSYANHFGIYCDVSLRLIFEIELLPELQTYTNPP